MARGIYVGVSGKARRVKKIYIGVGDKARKVKKIYIGVGGKAKLVWQWVDYNVPKYKQMLNNSVRLNCSNGVNIGNYCIFAGGNDTYSTTGSNGYVAYNGSLAQSTGQFTSAYGTTCNTGVTTGDYAWFANHTTRNGYTYKYSSMDCLRRLNASLTVSELATNRWLSDSMVAPHKGSLLLYGGMEYTNGSTDYGTRHGDKIDRYDASLTHTSINVTTNRLGYDAGGCGASVGNYAILEVGTKGSMREALTLNQSFTLGSNITFTHILLNGEAMGSYAVFTTRTSSGRNTYLTYVNPSLTRSYANSGYYFIGDDFYRNLLQPFGESVITASASNSNSVTCSHWIHVNRSLTISAIARTTGHNDDRSPSPIGTVGTYVLRPAYAASQTTEASFNKVEVLQA